MTVRNRQVRGARGEATIISLDASEFKEFRRRKPALGIEEIEVTEHGLRNVMNHGESCFLIISCAQSSVPEPHCPIWCLLPTLSESSGIGCSKLGKWCSVLHTLIDPRLY